MVDGASVASAGKASGLAAARRGHGRAALQARRTAWWAGAGAAGRGPALRGLGAARRAGGAAAVGRRDGRDTAGGGAEGGNATR